MMPTPYNMYWKKMEDLILYTAIALPKIYGKKLNLKDNIETYMLLAQAFDFDGPMTIMNEQFSNPVEQQYTTKRYFSLQIYQKQDHLLDTDNYCIIASCQTLIFEV